MCGRFTGVSFQEMLDIARDIEREAASRQVELPFASDGVLCGVDAPAEEQSLFPELEPMRRDAFPGGIVPVVAATPQGLQVANLIWGYQVPWQKGPVFNARVETAMSPERNMWAESLRQRRCLIATHGFYEPSATETVTNPRTGRQVKRQYRFTLPGEGVFFLAGVYQGNRFSVMTCEPNRWVAPVHPRMPLALYPHEAPVWLSHQFPSLFDRSALQLEAQ